MLWLSVFRSFILRNALRSPIRVAITLLGVTLGVALVVAVQLANSAALSSFRASTVAVAGETSLSILARNGVLTDQDYVTLLPLRETVNLSPVVEGLIRVEGADGLNETVQLTGIDLVLDRSLRRYEIYQLEESSENPTSVALLEKLAAKDAILLSKRLAERAKVRVGAKIRARVNDQLKTLTVIGILKEVGPAAQQAGNVAIADIASAQWILDQPGFLSRIDLKSRSDSYASENRSPGASTFPTSDSLAAQLPPHLYLEEPVARVEQLEKLIASFHFNLQALASIALIVAVFLIYSFVSSGVLQRRREIGILRSLGLSNTFIQSLFLVEGLLFAILGGISGISFGPWLANAVLQSTIVTVETFYLAQAAIVGIEGEAWSLEQIVPALLATIALTLAASWFPAREAGQVSALDAIKPRLESTTFSALEHRWLIAAGSFFVLSLALAQLPLIASRPIGGYAAALAAIIGTSLLSPLMIASLGQLVRHRAGSASERPLSRYITLRLAVASLVASRRRLAPAVSALAIALSMMFAVSIMVGSFRDTVRYWLEQTLAADIFVRPAVRETPTFAASISADVENQLRAHPEIIAVNYFAPREIRYAGEQVVLAVGDLAIIERLGGLVFKQSEKDKSALKMARETKGAIVSESFSLRYGKVVGSEVCLPFAMGERCLQVHGVYYDYASNRGTVVLDKETFIALADGREAPPRPGNLALYLHHPERSELVRQDLIRTLASDSALVIESRQGVKAEALKIFDDTFSITYALQLIAILVAALGVASSLSKLVLERAREIAIGRALGLDRLANYQILMWEGALLGTIALLLGLGLGVGLSLLLIFVINVQSFGWTIQYLFPWPFVLSAGVSVIFASTLAGLMPAQALLRRPPAEELRYE